MKKIKYLTLCFTVTVLTVLAFSVFGLNTSALEGKIDYSSVFDAQYYKTAYPDLKNAFGDNSSALYNHFVNYGMAEGRTASGEFDFNYYYNSNPDLRAAFGQNKKDYYTHYISFGKKEGRAGSSGTSFAGIDYSLVYDYEFYKRRYGDLRNAFGDNKNAYIKHFVENGMAEGRRANDTFDFAYYRNVNLDLKAAFGTDNKAYFMHYINYGVYENRDTYNGACYNGSEYDAVYNYYYYKTNNPDLQEAFGNVKRLYIWHFVTCGISEGRTASQSFNLEVYKEYEDLKKAFGDDNLAYYLHYMTCGYKEGRIAATLTKGIDVSKHNKDIDWQKVKNSGIQFAIIRLGFGDNYDDEGGTKQDDEKAYYNMLECERLSIPYGVYLYSYATKITGKSSAEGEAKHLRRVLGDHKPALGIWYDIEDKCQYSISNEQLTDQIVKFFDDLSDIDCDKGIYSSLNIWRTRLTSDKLSKYKRWVAHWKVPACGYQGEYTMWQYTSDGSVDGIVGRVDMNYYYYN